MQHTRKRAGLLKSALLAAAFGGIGLASAKVAQAAPINWFFYSTNGTKLTPSVLTETFKSDQKYQPLPVSVSAFVYNPNNTSASQYYNSTHLYNKVGPGGNPKTNTETGLGLNIPLAAGNDPDHEIVKNSFIQIDISNLTDPPLGQLTLSFQGASVSGSDAYKIWGTNTAGNALSGALGSKDSTTQLANATSLYAGSANQDFTIAPNVLTNSGGQVYQYLDVTATNGNILIKQLDSSIPNSELVPEPGSLALLGTGLFGLGLVARRRRRKV